jgi:sulfatase modifying factor 1
MKKQSNSSACNWIAFTLLLVLFGTFSSSAQVRDIYGNAVSSDLCNQIMSFESDEEVERLVTKIMDVYGLPNRFIIGPCPRVPNAVATVDKNGAPAILYNPDFLKKVKVFSFTASDLPTESEDWGVLLVFAHEIGHHLCNHITSPHPDLTQRDMELEADERAGYILYLLNAPDLKTAQSGLRVQQVSEAGTYSHPPKNQRLEAFKKGWDKAAERFPRPGSLSDKDGDGISNEKDGCPDRWSSNPSGCPDDDNINSDLQAWRRAKEQNTISAFNDYLIRFPVGEFREEAAIRLGYIEQEQKALNDNSAWEVADEKNTKEGYQKYLDKYPSGLHAAEARKHLEQLDKPDFMVLIPGGTFNMGSENGDSDEKPVHQVTLSDFYLGKYEVTVAEFRVFVNDTGYKTDAEKGDSSKVYEYYKWTNKSGINWRNDAEGKTAQDNHPVIHVSWNDAKAYCDWLSKKSGKTYRLPTEAEWEYAAGNGSRHTRYSWGDDAPSGKRGGNLADETGASGFNWKKTAENILLGYTDGFKATAPAGSFLANDFGLYDMTGNVWEWCSDWKGDYPSGSQTNPTGPANGSYRVVRGGSWYSLPQRCRVADRDLYSPGNRYGNLGFRLARTK